LPLLSALLRFAVPAQAQNQRFQIASGDSGNRPLGRLYPPERSPPSIYRVDDVPRAFTAPGVQGRSCRQTERVGQRLLFRKKPASRAELDSSGAVAIVPRLTIPWATTVPLSEIFGDGDRRWTRYIERQKALFFQRVRLSSDDIHRLRAAEYGLGCCRASPA